MAQEAVNTVIQALEQGFRGVQDIQARQQQQKQFEAEQALRQQEQDAREAQQKIQNEANQKLFDLQKAQLEHSQAQQSLQDALTFQRTGIAQPGTQVIPGVQPTATQPLVLSGLENTKLITPQGQTLTVPPLSQSPEVQLAQQQAQAQEQRQIEVSRATQAAETTRQIELARVTQAEETKRFLSQIALQKQYDSERANAEIRGRLAIANMESAERLRAAMIGATGGLSEVMGGNLFGQPKGAGQGGASITSGQGGPPQINIPGPIGQTINQSLTNIYKGTDSLERQEKVNPKFKQMISSAAAMYNVGSLTDADVKDLKDTQLMSEAAPILQQMHMLKKNFPNEINIPGTNAFSQFNSLGDQLDTLVPRIATATSGSKRMSEPELKRYFDGLVPSRLPFGLAKASAENEKYNKFITEDLWGRANKVVQGLPDSQQKAILSQYGFTKLPSTIVNQPGGIRPNKVIQWTRDANGNLVQVPQQ